VAAASGKVVAKYFSSVYGNRLFVYVGRVNGKNLTIVYNHAASYGVGVGQQVSRGQVVGSVGDTGWSTACHLHFTVLADGRPVNPMNYL
jgi:murein DD-endopeptidase MepM/ murein hydrolase activator NlpD